MYPLIETIYVQAAIACFAIFLLLQIMFFLRKYWIHSLEKQYSIVDRINALLPQTQCGRCGYAGCRPYAKAMSLGEQVNKCPPGGESTIVNLSLMLNEHKKTLDPAHGEFLQAAVAVIREEECIGCTKCIQACPVDAILGGTKLMHTVIESECTACDLCIEPCPVDCIDLIQLPPLKPLWQSPGTAERGLSGRSFVGGGSL